MSLRRLRSIAGFVGLQRDHHQEARVRLGDDDALLHHLARQARRRQRDLVLHLHLRDVGVGAGLEGQRDAGASAGARLRGEVEQVIDAGQLLLDHLRHRFLGGVGAGARIARADRDLRRRDARIGLDAQVLRPMRSRDCNPG